MRFCISIFLVAVLAFTLVSAELTEADFRKMKVKDLRAFLSERGLECTGCQEKNDFIRMAYQYRSLKPAGSPEKRAIPAKKFWEAWADIAQTECEKAVKLRSSDPTAEPFKSVCSTIHSATDSYLMQHGRKVANQLKKTPLHLLKTSFKDIYFEAGSHLFQILADYCLASPAAQENCQSLGAVISAMDGVCGADFKKWTTNVGIENTNPMYEIIDMRDDL